MSKTDIRFARERFDKGHRFYKTKDIAPQRVILRIVKAFAASTGTYTFDLKKDPSIAHVVENLLKRSDLLVATRVGLALMAELDAAKGTAPLLSFPLVTGNLPTGLKGLTNTNAYAVYNGALTFKTGQVVNVSKFPTAPFLHVPRTQPSILFTPSDDAIVGNAVHPEFNLDNVMMQLPEEIVFAGTKEQPITLDFPACTIAAETDCTAYAVLLIEGWLYENGTTEDCHSPENPYNNCF